MRLDSAQKKASPIYLGPKNLDTFWCTACNCLKIFRCASIHGRAGFILLFWFHQHLSKKTKWKTKDTTNFIVLIRLFVAMSLRTKYPLFTLPTAFRICIWKSSKSYPPLRVGICYFLFNVSQQQNNTLMGKYYCCMADCSNFTGKIIMI
jgi:hypothetical protein